jgi:hypothetical protein
MLLAVGQARDHREYAAKLVRCCLQLARTMAARLQLFGVF